MVQGLVRYPGAGCVVEFMQGNAPQIAWVLEEQNGRLRLLLPNRRETALQAARILPWPGPAYEKNCSRDAGAGNPRTPQEPPGSRQRRSAGTLGTGTG